MLSDGFYVISTLDKSSFISVANNGESIVVTKNQQLATTWYFQYAPGRGGYTICQVPSKALDLVLDIDVNQLKIGPKDQSDNQIWVVDSAKRQGTSAS